MAFQTDGGLFGAAVAGTDLRIGADLLDYAHVIEHVHTNKPSIAVRYTDNKIAAAAAGLFQDGAKIAVQIGDGRNNPLQYAFRQFGLDGVEPKGAGDLVELAGVADIVPYFTSVVKGVHKGNASDVIQQLAQQFGIGKIDIDATQDKMTWRADNRTVAQWVRNVVDHAWMGQGKSPLKALTSDGGQWMLRVKDILKQGSSQKTIISHGLSGAGQDGTLASWNHLIKTHGGALNSFANYGLKLVTNNLGGGVEDLFNININALSQFIGINGDLQKAVGIARTIFTPASHGNTHDNYFQARHANTKSRAAFSTEVRVLLHEQSGLRLLDDVTTMLATAAGDIDHAYSGAYKVSGITRSVQRGNYTELLTLVSQGAAAMAGGS